MVSESPENKLHLLRDWEYTRESSGSLSGRHPAEQQCAPCNNIVCGMKHSVSCSDPEHASHLHTEGSSTWFFVCAEFRECIFGLHREHKCAVHLKQGLLS